MIIKLTPAEIKGFVATSLDLNPSRFDIEIVNPDTSLLAAFRQACSEYPCDKIACTNRFRELAPKRDDCWDGYTFSAVSLANAKWAVENPTVALANLERTGNIRG